MGPLVVLAYSGGLDTSAIVPWLRERYGARVVCFAADVGQGGGELAGLAEKAKRSGAADCVIEDLLAYVRAKGIPVQATVEKPYSTDRNLWHCSHEGGILEDPSQEAPEHIFVMTKNPVDAPAEPVVVHVGFEEGTPVAVDHVPLGPVELLEALNDVAGEHGVGRADVVEDRLVGMKSRGVYETPGGTLLYAAHRELEQLVLDRRTLRLKDEVALRYA